MSHTPGTSVRRNLEIIEAQLDEIDEHPLELISNELELFVAVAARMLTTFGRAIEASILIKAIDIRQAQEDAHSPLRALDLDRLGIGVIDTDAANEAITRLFPHAPVAAVVDPFDSVGYDLSRSLDATSLQEPSVYDADRVQRAVAWTMGVIEPCLDADPYPLPAPPFEVLEHKPTTNVEFVLRGVAEPFPMPGDVQGFDAERLDGQRPDLVDKIERYGEDSRL